MTEIVAAPYVISRCPLNLEFIEESVEGQATKVFARILLEDGTIAEKCEVDNRYKQLI